MLATIAAVLAAGVAGLSASGASARAHAAPVPWPVAKSAKAGGGMAALVKAAKAEGHLSLIGIRGSEADYAKEIATFSKLYGIKVTSEHPTDSSAQAIRALHPSHRSSAPDVVDVDQADAETHMGQFAPYKVATWARIPAAQKDRKGRWVNDYGGYISFGCNLRIVRMCPTSWAQLEERQYRGDVALSGIPTTSGLALAAVWAAALNTGGSLTDILPGVDFFKQLASKGIFNRTACDASSLIEANQCPILISLDDVNTPSAWGLPSIDKWQVVDPQGAPFAVFNDQAISRAAPHPAAARLWEEFLYSTRGQNIWLEGGVRPVELAAMVKAGTENKAAYAKLPVETEPARALPTAGQQASAFQVVKANWTAGLG
jgi:putative spermidine/putrescine transport system substrate-binding protein